MLVADFLDAGVGLFDVPIELSALSPADQSSFQEEWRRFTRMYAHDPAGGRACMEAAIEEMWRVEKAKWPPYISEACLLDLRVKWLPTAMCSILENVVAEGLYTPPVNLDLLEGEHQAEAKAAWRGYLSRSRADAEPLAAFKLATEAQWALEKTKLPAYFDDAAVALAEEKWLLENFTKVVKECAVNVLPESTGSAYTSEGAEPVLAGCDVACAAGPQGCRGRW